MKYKEELNIAISEPAKLNESFTVKLFRLILKADDNNLKLLSEIYPGQCSTFFAYKRFGISLTNEDILIGAR